MNANRTMDAASIRQDFPKLSPEWAQELADRLENSPCAQENILQILNSLEDNVTDLTAELITQQMDIADDSFDDPDGRVQYPESYYSYEDGFTPIRSRVTALACTALTSLTVPELTEQLEAMAQWLECAEAMNLKPELQTWDDCLLTDEEWRRHVLGGENPARAAQLMGRQDGRFSAWNSMIHAQKTSHCVIAAILNEQDLLTESIRTDPCFYRYVHTCRENRARPFTIISDQTGETIALCLLRFRKGRWYAALPTQMDFISMEPPHNQNLEEELKKFAKTYDNLAKKQSRTNQHQSWSYDPAAENPAVPQEPLKGRNHIKSICSRCNAAKPLQEAVRIPLDQNQRHSPIYCIPCRREAGNTAQEYQPAETQGAPCSAPCSICGQQGPTTPARTTDPQQTAVRLPVCGTCAAMAGTGIQLVRKPATKKKRKPAGTLALGACPGCSEPIIRGETKNPDPLCAQCLVEAISSIREELRNTTGNILKEETKLFELFHGNQCFRCEPAGEPAGRTGTIPHSTPGRCLNCRDQYRAKTRDRRSGIRECQACYAAKADFQARTETGERVTICEICALIGTEFQIFTRETSIPISVTTCITPSCNNLQNPYVELCQQCHERVNQETARRQPVVTYLHQVLEARQQGETEPEPPSQAAGLLRPDSTQVRPDAAAGRLTGERSRELCREYLQENREIPELAIRFNVSIQAVRNTLLGRTWAKHTQDTRPERLRPEPQRIPKPRPPQPAHITITRLRSEYGWTSQLVDKHLGEHDREAPNPHYRSAAPMRLYLLDRVQETMAGNPGLRQQLQEILDRRQKNQEHREENTLKRRQELLRQTELLGPIIIMAPTRDASKLMGMATESRRRFLEETLIYEDYEIPVNDGSITAQERAVSMIRHEFTNYEQLLEEMPRSRDLETNALIYRTLKTRVMKAIADEVPQLAQACLGE